MSKARVLELYPNAVCEREGGFYVIYPSLESSAANIGIGNTEEQARVCVLEETPDTDDSHWEEILNLFTD